MASLFIKDADTAALANKIAGQLGTTKTEAVKRGLTCLAKVEALGRIDVVGKTSDWLREYRDLRPLADRHALEIDKAFYDSLSDEDDVFDPWS